jgi:hypothetical protein
MVFSLRAISCLFVACPTAGAKFGTVSKLSAVRENQILKLTAVLTCPNTIFRFLSFPRCLSFVCRAKWPTTLKRRLAAPLSPPPPGAAPGASQAAHHSQLGFLRRQTTGTGLINQPSTRWLDDSNTAAWIGLVIALWTKRLWDARRDS